MQRQSDKHSARQDEELKQEMEGRLRSTHPTRADESLDAEPPADDDPVLAEDPVPGVGSDTAAPDESTALRLDLARHLEPAGFPTDRATLLDRLRTSGAPERLLAAMRRLPEAREYNDVQDVVTTLDEEGDA